MFDGNKIVELTKENAFLKQKVKELSEEMRNVQAELIVIKSELKLD